MSDVILPAVRKRRPKKGTVTFVTRPPSEEVLAKIRAKWAGIRERIYGKDPAPGALPLKRDLPPSRYNDPAFWGVKAIESRPHKPPTHQDRR